MLFSFHCMIAACSFPCVFVIVIEHKTQSHSMHLYVCNTLSMMHWTKHKIRNIFNCLTLAQWDQSVPARCYPQVRWDSYHSLNERVQATIKGKDEVLGVFLTVFDSWCGCAAYLYNVLLCCFLFNPNLKTFYNINMMLLILKIHRSKSVI